MKRAGLLQAAGAVPRTTLDLGGLGDLVGGVVGGDTGNTIEGVTNAVQGATQGDYSGVEGLAAQAGNEVLAHAGKGAATGAGVGGSIGSVVPGIGNLLGALVGALAGFLASIAPQTHSWADMMETYANVVGVGHGGAQPYGWGMVDAHFLPTQTLIRAFPGWQERWRATARHFDAQFDPKQIYWDVHPSEWFAERFLWPNNVAGQDANTTSLARWGAPGPDGEAEYWAVMYPDAVARITAAGSPIPSADQQELVGRVTTIQSWMAAHPEWVPTDPANVYLMKTQGAANRTAYALQQAQAAAAAAVPVHPPGTVILPNGQAIEPGSKGAQWPAINLGAINFGAFVSPFTALAANPAAHAAQTNIVGAATGNQGAASQILGAVGNARGAAASAAVKLLADTLTAAQKAQVQAQFVQKFFGAAEAQKILAGYHFSVADAVGMPKPAAVQRMAMRRPPTITQRTIAAPLGGRSVRVAGR